MNYDGGGILGFRTKAQADSIVTTALSLWTDVNTSTVTLGRGADLPVDVTAANYTAYFDSTDGLNPVIYDTDGSIIDIILGAGQKNNILGFAGSALLNCQYTEGFAVINGLMVFSDTQLTNVIAHEVGHLIGLDHAQLDDEQGLTDANYPLMYPIARRNTISLHEDDVAAVSALYPNAALSSAYGQLTGTFTQINGTAIRGANLWAQETNTNKLFSIVSDYLMQNTGYFKLLLPAGNYTLHAAAVQTWFRGGSGVGPYSGVYPTGLSFQPPLYDGGVAMTPVILGNAMPIQFAITTGCAATATFKLDGTGSVVGNCGSSTADITAPSVPAGLTVAPAGATQVNLSWTASMDAVGVTGYKVYRDGVMVANPNLTNYSNTGLTTSTIYSYTVAACDAAGNCSAQSASASATTAVSVAPNCTLIASSTTITAAGGTSILTATCDPVAASYIWANTGFAATVSIGTVSPTVSTTYSVVGSNAAGSGNTASVTVTMCTYALSPTSQSVPFSSTDGTLSVTSASVCAWSASSNVSWITITSGSSGSGNGTVSYLLPANTNGSSTIGTLTIAGQTFTVTQAGMPVPTCTLSASASTITLGSSAILTATCSPGATSYVWIGGPCAGTTGASCTVTPSATTTSTVAGSNAGGTGNRASTTVAVIPPSTFTPICTLSPTPASIAAGNVQMIGTVADPSSASTSSGSCLVAGPQAGIWWNPAEGGRGFVIEQRGNNLFFGAFLYDSSGTATWYAASGTMNGNTFNSTLTTYANGQRLTGPYMAPIVTGSAGAISVTFTDASHGTLTWPRGTIPIQRFDIVTGGAAMTPPAGTPETGIWWNPAESGRGFALEIQNGIMFLGGYIFDAGGNPIWYSSGQTPMTDTKTYIGTWEQYGNGQTLTGTYKPATVLNSNVGSVKIQFSDTQNALLTLPDGRQIPITRFRF